MKKLIILITIVLTAMSCVETKEEKAESRLDAARLALEREDFNGAKLQIDSIKILYPKEFKVRKAAQDLMCIVVLKEQQRNLRYLSTVLQTRQQEFDAIKRLFLFEKVPQYQEIGHYVWPTQSEARNMKRTYLRFQVSEQGQMSMVSVYHGSNFIHHRIIKATAPDGTYATTPSSANPYEDNYMGSKFERNDYIYGKDGGVINFLYLNIQKSIRLTFKGGGQYSMVFSSSDRQALKHIYSLARIMTSIQNLKKAIEEANTKIKFVLTKQKYDALSKNKSTRESDHNIIVNQ